MQKQLTEKFIKSKLSPKRYYDQRGNGLHLLVRKSGTKSWVQRTTIKSKKIDLGLGSYPKVSLAAARASAQTNIDQIRIGQDPRTTKIQAEQSPLFREVVPMLLQKKEVELSNAKHFAQWKSTLQTYAYPEIGDIPVDQLTASHIEKCLIPIWNSKTETATRLRGRIERVLDYAISKKFMDAPNPAAWANNLEFTLPKPSTVQEKQHLPAIQLNQTQRWWRDLKERDGVGAKALMLLTLTATRSGEIRGMRWDEISYEISEELAQSGCEAVWTIPANRMKARKPHTVALSKAMIEIIDSLPKKCEFVFSSAKGNMLSDMTLSKLMKRMHASSKSGYLDATTKKIAVPHGLRSTFRDWAAVNGKSREAAELQLAHRIGGVVEHSYYRTDLLEIRAKLMHDWFDFLENRKSS